MKRMQRNLVLNKNSVISGKIWNRKAYLILQSGLNFKKIPMPYQGHHGCIQVGILNHEDHLRRNWIYFDLFAFVK